MTHYGRWADRFCTRASGRVDKDTRNALEKLPRDAKLHLLELHDGGHGFEFWQTGDGIWHVRVKVGTATTECARATAADALTHCLSARGAEVVP